VALVPDPGARWRLDLVKGRWRQDDQPILDRCRCPACAGGFSRAYLHYLLRADELTGLRLVTLHNLHFVAGLMEELRSGVDKGTLDQVTARLRAGAAAV
jgi:queuine tRNA-ribosyltransferase